MNRIEALIAIILIIVPIHGIGQEKAYLITLEPTPIEKKEFYISKVVDFRPQKNNIGVAVKGLFDEEVAAKFSEDLETHLMKTFEVLLPNSPLKTPLIVRVKRLFISERISTFYELGRCELTLEFLKQVGSKLYTLGTFSSVIEKKGLDLTETHDERIVEALTHCIDQFSESDWNNSGVKRILATRQQPKLNPKNPLKKGLYLSFAGIASNTPIDGIAYQAKKIKKTKKIERYQVYREGTKKRIKDIFGFSDGASIYLSAATFTGGQYFVKSKIIGRYIYFEDEFSLPEMGLAFGWIGSLASLENRGIILDSNSGLTTVLTAENMKLLLGEHSELLDFYKKGDKSTESVREIIRKLNAKENGNVP